MTMRYTTNYGLLKPEGTEFYNVEDQNDNMDIIDDELKTATNIAKGRNQALVYSTYADMVAALNTMQNDELKVGQNIYIGSVGVPDIWIYKVSEDSTEYVYVSDEAIIEAVESNVSLQIGYYEIAFLETQKVDLTTIEEEISDLNDSLDSYFQVKKLSGEKDNITSLNNATISIPANILDGYTPIGIVGHSLNTAVLLPSKVYLTESYNAVVRVYNTHVNTQAASVDVYVLYVKNNS